MIGRSDCSIKKIFFSLLILSGLTASLFSQDKQISGVINVYKHVAAIGPGLDNVTLVNVDSIAKGDTVLLVQMKGVIINVPGTGSYGSYKDFVGAPGLSEFLIVDSVNTETKNVVFTNDILKSYDVTGIVQLIKVPFYNSATVNADLTCQPWDSINKTGGVLAMIVGRTLSLEANIDVTGKGFYGGTPFLGQGICIETNTAIYDTFSYPVSYLNSGFKGESPVIKAFLDLTNIPSYYPAYAKGKGANFTGGGGGNGRYSGGGGGSNYGAGGKGGRESGTCAPLLPGEGGAIGKEFKTNVDLYGGIFMGGGGGSSTHGAIAGSTASQGGRGGGIIIILCDTLKGKGKTIKADGATTTTALLNAGSGGGGGGGSIALYQQSFSTQLVTSSLTISANGGKGGNNDGQLFGEGGGGGGGFILTNNISIPGNVTKSVTGGAVGTRQGASTGGTGTPGESLTTFTPVLNGFLFNSIRSEVTGNQVDSICSDVAFGLLTGTQPVGGVAPYSYLWKSSITSDSTGFADAPGVDTLQNYSPGLLTQTTWFRRVVNDNDAPALVDISKPVKIIVQQAITGNLVGKDTTICYNQNPLGLIPLNAGPSNGSSHNYYKYKWLQNTTIITWDTTQVATGSIINAPGYDPPNLTDTTYYKRHVTSGRCVDYSPTVTISVLPLITGNITARPDSVICEGSLFNNLGASAPGGGDLINYWIQWQDSVVSSVWNPAVGTNTNTIYIPDTSTFAVTEQRFLRRVVFSGPDSVCKSRSVPIHLIRYHSLKNNSILANQTICSGSPPAKLTGSNPLNGNGIYTYTWQDSTKSHTWMDIPGAIDITIPDYQPPVLTDTTRYRRIVFSSACSDISKSIQIIVHKPILNNSITLLSGGLTDTTLCNGAVPHLLKGTVPTGGTNIPGDYAYLWFVSTDNAVWNPPPGATSTLSSYQPPALAAATYYYKRQVISGACTEISNTITVTVLPSITNNTISANQTVCYNTAPGLLTGATLSGGAGAGAYLFLWEQSSDGTTWTPAAETNNLLSGSYQPPALIIPMKYKRTVTSGASGCCTSISNVIDITIYPPLPTGTITSTADTTICEGSKVRIKIHLTGQSNWKVVYNENSTPFTINKIAGIDTTLIVGPATPTALTTFTYSLVSVVDKNNCFATLLTGTRKADVYKIPIANAGPDAVVCGPEVTLNATPSAGTGTWYYPAAVVTSTANNPSVTVTIDSTFAGGNITHKFIWEEINWQCKNKDSLMITFDKRVNSINAGRDTGLFSFDNIIHMVAHLEQTWETGLWTLVSGTGDPLPNSDTSAVINNLSKGLNTFLWTVTNSTCKNEDKVNVNVYELVVPEGFSPNNDPGNYNNTFIITGLDLPNQLAELIVVNGAGTEVFSTSNRDGQTWTDWDGKNSKGLDLPEGTYYYLLKITSAGPAGNGQVFKKSGFVVLKRY